MVERTLPEIEARAVELYGSTYSPRMVAAEVGLGRTTVYRILRRNRVEWKPNKRGPAWNRTPENVEREAAEMYSRGMVSEVIADRLGITRGAVYGSLRRHHVPMRESGGPRLYSVDETFFNEIDTEAKAYWLGFITADGHIEKRTVQLGLKSDDIGHIEKFLAAIKSTQPVKLKRQESTYGRTEMAHVSVGSVGLANGLRKHGIVGNKRLNAAPLKNIAPELERHYWRGLVDGDGTLFIGHNTNSRNPTISLCGTPEITGGFSSFVERITGGYRTVRSISKNGVTQIASVGGFRASQRVTGELYLDSSVYLERKMARARELMSLLPRQPWKVRPLPGNRAGDIA